MTRTAIAPSFVLFCLALFACSGDDAGGSGALGGSGGVPAAGSGGNPAAGAGGTAGGTGGTGMPAGLPVSDSAADLTAFLTAGTYRNAPWRAETTTPRDTDPSSLSPHLGKVQVWMNPPLVDSLKNGRSGRNSEPKPDPYSMAVKEFYDAAGTTVVGRALVYHSGTATDAWAFGCLASATERCGSEGATPDVLLYGRGSTGPGCYLCHSPMFQPFYSPPPP